MRRAKLYGKRQLARVACCYDAGRASLLGYAPFRVGRIERCCRNLQRPASHDDKAGLIDVREVSEFRLLMIGREGPAPCRERGQDRADGKWSRWRRRSRMRERLH